MKKNKRETVFLLVEVESYIVNTYDELYPPKIHECFFLDKKTISDTINRER